MIPLDRACQSEKIVYDRIYSNSAGVERMAISAKEREWADRVRRYIKAELKRANVTYAELARRLNEHGFEGETEASVNSKLVRGTFSVTFFVAVLAVLGIAAVVVADL
jgi:hypothetical protein